MRRLLVAALLLPIVVSVAAAQPSFMSILPAGQDGFIPASDPGLRGPHLFDQLPLYDALPRAVPGITNADLLQYFKDATVAAPANPERVDTPRPGVTIARDAFGMPHVRGETRADVFFGAGWVTAQDRLFLADVLRHMGRGRLSEFLGPIPGFGVSFSIGFDRTYWRVAGHSEAELEQQLEDANARQPELGARATADTQSFVDGMNAYVAAARTDATMRPAEYDLFGIELEDWKQTDVLASGIAFITVIGFGNGGGGEHRNLQLWQALVERLGERKGTRLYDDLRAGDDKDAPLTTGRKFPYMLRKKIDEQAVAVFDPGSFAGFDPVTVGSAGGAFTSTRPLPVPEGMSNWIAVTAKKADGGRPILVGGPQTGYFAPQGLFEMALEGPGINAQGATPPGVPWVTLGHTPDYAFTATAGGSDLTDVYVERLCTPDGGTDGSGTLFDGACVPMTERTESWMAGSDQVTVAVRRTVHGPVVGTATVDGEPVVLARRRTSFGREVDSAATYMLLNENYAQTPELFRDAMQYNTGSLNWLYMNREDVAFLHSGLFPVRAPGVDPDFPAWGTGQWEWQGEMPITEHPFDVNPKQGFMTSWNNKPARAWRAADDNHGYTSAYRSVMLDSRVKPLVKGRGKTTLAQVVEAMADAATVDLRGEVVLPEALPFAQKAKDLAAYVALLRDWSERGAHRIDRDQDGHYEDEAAVALMDAWWDPLIRAMFDPQLDGIYGLVRVGFHDAPSGHRGSAFQGGYYGTVRKALRQAKRRKVKGRYKVLRCGGGNRKACAAAVQDSLRTAVEALTERFGSADPADWTFDPTEDQIEFTVAGLALPLGGAFPWQNRPTFQQAVQILD
jgi:acyl-homoserine lactone acylase PvdQ